MIRHKFPLDFPKGFAKAVGMDPVHISRIKHGKLIPSRRLALKLYKAALGRVRLMDILQTDQDFLEVCQIVVNEASAPNE